MNIVEQRRIYADKRDQSKKTTWRGDHTFSPDAAKYSIENIIEPELAKKNPHWSRDQIHQEAVKKFQKRLAQDYEYEQKENIHEQTAVTWQIIETAPGVRELATTYGSDMVTLRELWQHTREFAAFVDNPKAYDPQEERAQMLMQEAFVNGKAQAYVSVLSHPDSIRYVQVWGVEESGEISSKQIDLYEACGRDFTHEEGKTLVQHLALYEKNVEGKLVEKTNVLYEHFFIDQGKMHDGVVHQLARALVLKTSEHVPIIPVISPVLKEVWGSADVIERDIELYFHEKIDKKIQHTTSDPIRNKLEKSVKKLHIESNRTTEVFRIDESHTDTIQSVITKVFTEHAISMSMIEMLPKLPAAAGATLFWFEQIFSAEVKPIEQTSKKMTFVESVQPKTILRKEKKLLMIFATSQKNIRQYMQKNRYLSSVVEVIEKKLGTYHRRKNKRIESVINTQFVSLPLVIEKLDTKKIEQPFIARRIRKLIFALHVLGVLTPKKIEHLEPSKQKIEVQSMHTHETPVWVLFAIIWYLSMLRETGLSSQNIQKKKRKKIKQTGVIYQHHS